MFGDTVVCVWLAFPTMKRSWIKVEVLAYRQNDDNEYNINFHYCNSSFTF